MPSERLIPNRGPLLGTHFTAVGEQMFVLRFLQRPREMPFHDIARKKETPQGLVEHPAVNAMLSESPDSDPGVINGGVKFQGSFGLMAARRLFLGSPLPASEFHSTHSSLPLNFPTNDITTNAWHLSLFDPSQTKISLSTQSKKQVSIPSSPDLSEAYPTPSP
ncbi:hypothetical protein BGZ60DRAFT_419208 [Tricladium varicosporioides]|nr:hypothetical protein BGZ60DRAFT_419208 [Hymenoscyphus varicosporioides]